MTFDRFTLPNGLEVVLAPDHTSQVVAVDLWYRAGSRDEPPAKAGLARLFERLMFAGSAHVPADGLAQLVDQAGGQVSAQVDEDDSRFSEVVPSNYLEQVLWLEADRMRGIVITDTTFAASRSALLDDLDQRDAQPYTGAIMDAVAALYDSAACPGYGHRGTGLPRTVAALTVEDARTFFAQHYQPNNASLVIAGDFDPAATRSLVTRWFAGIPRGPDAPAPGCRPSFSPGPVRRAARSAAGTRPAVGHFYRLPDHGHT
ncbi:MAG TPA: pitrilysin family protein, partial [Gemmatimonadales bacterium]|nr:pitrilysin family protein [Gemmatimonadales bacterium]